MSCEVTGNVKMHVLGFSNKWDWYVVGTNHKVGLVSVCVFMCVCL